MGRFLSPDWSAKAEPVPYAKLADPQSLNLYVYVLNNPLSHVDPDGHTCKAGDWGCNAWNTAAQNWNQIHGIVNQASSKVTEFETNHPRTTKALKGGLKVATGAATIGVAATGEVGSGGLATVPVVFAVMGGASAIAGGVSDLAGAAFNTDTSKASEAVDAVENPAALITTAVTRGNLKAGAAAGAIGDALVTGATIKDLTEGSLGRRGISTAPAGQSFSEGAKAVNEATRPTSSNPDDK
jgi:hypothetical protein